MKRSTFALGSLIFASVILLGACSEGNSDSTKNAESVSSESSHNEHEGMDHSGSAEVPEGLREAEKPAYPPGSKAQINADHMPGMNGAEAMIIGAYQTTAYSLSYTSSTTGEKVQNHKWVIYEELKDPPKKGVKPGSEVTVNADHSDGMSGAKAQVEFSEETTVYMVDYTDTDNGEDVTNHKWVTESELSATP
ncbi:YdhK family protein [Halobacillus halophilus]|uniref:YdhK family protein n=1 Tax=Halobacillus halophilus TaxID=1570 RepID=UPI001CD19941|nr:YdhK family protein [Halobacillus halophilus]MCA1010345.1 YdhK family protein [Halobacillus halophilus]